VTRPRLFLVAALVLALPRAASAAGGVAPVTSADEIRALDGQIAAALSTRSCVVACEALGSMARAADRLCALEPGPRCDEARARVSDAQRRVQEACPECAIGGRTSPPVQASEAPPAPPPPAPVAEMVAVGKRGGCAGCVVGGDGVPDGSALAALGALAVLARRRSRRR
jgi:hypothetical protein